MANRILYAVTKDSRVNQLMPGPGEIVVGGPNGPVKVPDRVIDVTHPRFGAKGDGTTDDAAAVTAAWNALMAAGGGTLFFGAASGKYRIATNTTLVATAPVVIDLNGQTIDVPTGTTFQFIGASQPALTLASPVARGDKTLTVTSASGVQPGDILELFENVSTESEWNYGRCATFCVRSVSGNVLILTSTSKMLFSTAATVSRYRHTTPFRMRNGTLYASGTPADYATSILRVRGLMAPRFAQMTGRTDQGWISGGPTGCPFHVTACVGAVWEGTHLENCGYGILLQGPLNSQAIGTTARNVRHPVSPSVWAVGVKVDGLTTADCWQSIETHPAFEVHYANVYAARDETMPNLRCIGGSITNATVSTDATDSDTGPYYHSLGLADPSWYTNESLTLRDFTVIAPNRTLAVIGADRGRVLCENVVAPMGGNPKFATTLQSLTLTNCRQPDGTPWGRSVSRIATRVGGPAKLDAVNSGGVYHLDLFKTLLDATGGVIRCGGRVFSALTTEPSTVSLRIHDNAFPAATGGNQPNYVWGILRLRVFLRHSNAGLFDILTSEYQFYHRIVATSSLSFPLVAARTDGLTGQANESLAIALSNPVQAGATELGTNYPDTYAQIDISLSSGRTSPVYSLAYELELYQE